jgi:hypothetical protein
MWTEITRPKYEREGPRYASDLTDAEWALIEPHMPAVKRLGRPRETELRTVLDAIFYIADRLSVADAAEGLSSVYNCARLFLRLASALNHTDSTGQRSSLARMASADWVQTKGLGLAL